MSEITWGVEHTPMFPCAWYGGPYHNGQRHSNDTRYYFNTEGAAWDFVAQQRTREADAEIAKLRKELDEANEAVIAAQMLGFEKGKDAAKAELAEARKVIEELVALSDIKRSGVSHNGWSDKDVQADYKRRVTPAWEAARAFLAAKETQG